MLHPRPHLRRPRWTDLCGTWSFAYDDANRGRAENWCTLSPDDAIYDRRIVVPFPPESPASGIGDTSFHPVVWYSRTFVDVRESRTERLLLHLGAVDYRATVWVNGQLVAEHEGGHTPISTDITEALIGTAPGAEAVLVVRAEDLPGDLDQPRGKQDWQEKPHKIWYHRTTGIWQPVWLEPVPVRRIGAVRLTPDVDGASLGVDVAVIGSLNGLRLRVQLGLRGQLLADDTYTVTSTRTVRDIALPPAAMTLGRSHVLWSPENPNLVDVTVTLIGDGEELDEVESHAGLRSVGVSGGRFMLNGRPYFMRMVLEQGYWPESHLAAPSEDALRREVELIKELGFDGVRIHQKVEDPRFLYWCDRLGVLVWGEMANAYEFSPTAVDRLTREWLSAVERDYSVPSVVAWVPLNESWGVPFLERSEAQRHYVRALYSMTKAVDPTRPVIGNDGWEHVVSDIITVHDYTSSGARLRERYGSREDVEQTAAKVQPHYRTVVLPDFARANEPLMITEFGGITYRADPDTFYNAYGTVHDEAGFLDRYRDLVDALLDSEVVTGFCYTQLTDTMQEMNGLLDEHRQPKADIRALRRVLRRAPASVPGDAITELSATEAMPAPRGGLDGRSAQTAAPASTPLPG